MGIGVFEVKESLRLYMHGFFDGVDSVIDMGDQDLSISMEDLKYFTDQAGLTLNQDAFQRARFYPERPRVSSSVFWNMLGVNKADRLDLSRIERDCEDESINVYEMDLNEPLKNKELEGKYDLVTDFGNNEHPFNIVEAYKTMHKLAKKGGYLWVVQNVIKGNGFYNLDQEFFENIAVANGYSVIDSAYHLIKGNTKYAIPCENGILDCVDINSLDAIGINYIFRKNTEHGFVFPHQGGGGGYVDGSISKFYGSSITLHDKKFLKRNYIPNTADSLSTKKILSILYSRLSSKIPFIR